MPELGSHSYTVVQRTLFAQSTKPTVSVENEPPKEKNSSTDAPSSLVTPPPGFFEPPETELEKVLRSRRTSIASRESVPIVLKSEAEMSLIPPKPMFHVPPFPPEFSADRPQKRKRTPSIRWHKITGKTFASKLECDEYLNSEGLSV